MCPYVVIDFREHDRSEIKIAADICLAKRPNCVNDSVLHRANVEIIALGSQFDLVVRKRVFSATNRTPIPPLGVFVEEPDPSLLKGGFDLQQGRDIAPDWTVLALNPPDSRDANLGGLEEARCAAMRQVSAGYRS
jgi:hypothetical protein